MKYRSPGFKSDILRGNFLPQRTATSRIIAYRLGYVKTELYPNPLHMPEYDNIVPGVCQCFLLKKFVKIVKIFLLIFMYYSLRFNCKKYTKYRVELLHKQREHEVFSVFSLIILSDSHCSFLVCTKDIAATCLYTCAHSKGILCTALEV